MMDPITATGLAGNIFQFLDFGAKLVKAANELRHSPNTTENIHLLNNTSDLKRMSENISNSLEEGDDEQQFGQKSKEFRSLAEQCTKLAKQLEELLESCGITAEESPTRWLRARRALKSVRKKREIQEIGRMLETYRSQMTFNHLLSHDKLGSQLNAKNHDIFPVHPQTSDPIAVCNCCGSSTAHSQPVRAHLCSSTTTQQPHLSTSVSYQPQNNASAGTEGFGQVVVEKGVFTAYSVQENVTREEFANSMRNTIMPSLEEYKSKLMAIADQEIRSTIRAEMESVCRKFLQPVLEEIYANSSLESDAEEPNETEKSFDDDVQNKHAETDQSTMNSDPDPTPYHSVMDETSPNYLKVRQVWVRNWMRSTRIGIFQVAAMCQRIYRPNQPPETQFKCWVVFLPSIKWLCAGISLNYSFDVGPRGFPKLSTNLDVFGIIPEDDAATKCIEFGTVEEFRSMLDSRLLSAGDRFINGDTLFHRTASYCRLEFCQTLIFMGADVRAQNCCGWTCVDANVATDIGINCLKSGYPEKKQIFRYLYPRLGNDELNSEMARRMMTIQLSNVANGSGLVSDDSMAKLTDWLVFIRETHSEPKTWNGLLGDTIAAILYQLKISEKAEHWSRLKQLLQTMLDAGFDANDRSTDSKTTIHSSVMDWYIPSVRARTDCKKDCCKDYDITKDFNVQIFADLVALLLKYGADMNPAGQSNTLIDDLCDKASDTKVDDTSYCSCCGRNERWACWKLILDSVAVDSERLFEENAVRRRESCGVSTAFDQESEAPAEGVLTKRKGYMQGNDDE